LISAILPKLDKKSSAQENPHYTMAFLKSHFQCIFSQGLATLPHLKSQSMALTILTYHNVSYFNFTD